VGVGPFAAEQDAKHGSNRRGFFGRARAVADMLDRDIAQSDAAFERLRRARLGRTQLAVVRDVRDELADGRVHAPRLVEQESSVGCSPRTCPNAEHSVPSG
jgi:hypothetical protein